MQLLHPLRKPTFFLPLLSLLISLAALTSALAQHPHPPPHLSAPNIAPIPQDISHADTDITTPSPLKKRSNALPYSLRISGLPSGWSGVFTTFITTRPTIPIASVFIRFYKQAAQITSTQKIPQRYSQRFEFGVLVLEMMSTDAAHYVTGEFMHATALWLMQRAQQGWIGLFEAWVIDRTDGEMVYLRVGTIWDLPGGKVGNSPWD